MSFPYDVAARYSTKRDVSWTGYKVHLTETCDTDRPHLIVNLETRSSTEPDHAVTSIVHEQRRTLTILSPQSHFETQQWARQRQQTHEFRAQCATRAGVEGTISQAAVALGARRSLYRGIAKTHFQHLVTAAAINLLRVLDWLHEIPRSTTPKSHFARLAA